MELECQSEERGPGMISAQQPLDPEGRPEAAECRSRRASPPVSMIRLKSGRLQSWDWRLRPGGRPSPTWVRGHQGRFRFPRATGSAGHSSLPRCRPIPSRSARLIASLRTRSRRYTRSNLFFGKSIGAPTHPQATLQKNDQIEPLPSRGPCVRPDQPSDRSLGAEHLAGRNESWPGSPRTS
jgi:hypothetical protein